MSRRSIIICLAVLAVMIVGVGVAVAVLYSGVDSAQTRKGSFVPDQERYLLLPAVPADAALVACLSDVEDAVNGPLRGFRFPDALAAELAAGSFPSFSSASMVVSLHYGGKMNPLYVFDAGQVVSEPSEDASALMSFAAGQGLYAQFVDCSKASDGTRSIAKHSVVLVSDTETLVKSATRHLAEPISVMYAGGFADASQLAGGKDLVFVASHSAKTLMPVALAKSRSNISSPFIANLAHHKINKLHLHLSDDEGWRIEIKSHPALASIGGFRGGDSPFPATLGSFDKKYGGYYTQEELRDIVAYAMERNIEVIPEIDMPGHSEAFNRAMGFDMQSTQGKTALKKVLDEVAEVFADAPYIHIGGDELIVAGIQQLTGKAAGETIYGYASHNLITDLPANDQLHARTIIHLGIGYKIKAKAVALNGIHQNTTGGQLAEDHDLQRTIAVIVRKYQVFIHTVAIQVSCLDHMAIIAIDGGGVSHSLHGFIFSYSVVNPVFIMMIVMTSMV